MASYLLEGAGNGYLSHMFVLFISVASTNISEDLFAHVQLLFFESNSNLSFLLSSADANRQSHVDSATDLTSWLPIQTSLGLEVWSFGLLCGT